MDLQAKASYLTEEEIVLGKRRRSFLQRTLKIERDSGTWPKEGLSPHFRRGENLTEEFCRKRGKPCPEYLIYL